MTNDEIKEALKSKCRIKHNYREHQTAIIYHHVQAWRVTVDKDGRFISSLELVTGGNRPTVITARAEDCEIWRP